MLGASSLVTSLAVIRDAGVKPSGDLIMADIPREAANDVIDELRALGLQEEGAIQVVPVPTWISRNALRAEADAPGSGSDAVVWAEVTQRAYDDTEFTWTFGWFMIMATLIASIGIVLDSQILIIGAMVLGPEFGAVAALGLSLVRHRPRLFRRALRTLVGGFTVAILSTAALAAVGRAAGWIDLGDVVGPRPLTQFIYTRTSGRCWCR